MKRIYPSHLTEFSMKLQSSRILITLLILSSSLCMSAQRASELPLTLTITGPQTVTVGDTVTIHAILKNISKRTMSVSFGKRYTIVIHDENGKVPSRKPGVWAGSSASGDIKPGEAAEDFLTNLSSEYDFSSPAKYVVLFSRRLDDSDPKSPILESNEITINVTLPKKEQ